MSYGTILFIPNGASEAQVQAIIEASGEDVVIALDAEPDSNILTDELVDKINNVPVEPKVVYGIRWNSVDDIMVKGILVDNIFTPATYTDYPIQQQMKRGLLTTDGTFTELDPTDSSLLAAGGAATLDGSAGQVMVQVPKFYMLTTVIGDDKYLLVSEASFEFNNTTAWVPPIFGDDDYRYIGAFKGVAASDISDAIVKSIVNDTSGYTTNSYPNPMCNYTRAMFRTQQQDGFFPYCWGLYEVVWAMYLTEYADWDTQSTIPGYTDAAGYNYNYFRPAGRTLELGNASGSILVDLSGIDSDLTGIVASDGYIANSYRGIENFYGSVFEFIDGINVNNDTGGGRVWVCHNPVDFQDDVETNYIDTGFSLPPTVYAMGYVSDLCWSNENLTFYPSNLSGGSSSTFMCDWCYNSNGDWRVVVNGGFIAGGPEDYGFGYLNMAYGSSKQLPYLSARTAA